MGFPTLARWHLYTEMAPKHEVVDELGLTQQHILSWSLYELCDALPPTIIKIHGIFQPHIKQLHFKAATDGLAPAPLSRIQGIINNPAEPGFHYEAVKTPPADGSVPALHNPYNTCLTHQLIRNYISKLSTLWHDHIDGLVQDCSNSSASAMDLLQSYS